MGGKGVCGHNLSQTNTQQHFVVKRLVQSPAAVCGQKLSMWKLPITQRERNIIKMYILCREVCG